MFAGGPADSRAVWQFCRIHSAPRRRICGRPDILGLQEGIATILILSPRTYGASMRVIWPSTRYYNQQ